MSRLALYRKWRPMTFRDVVEQQHVVNTLKNALKSNAVGHAYLFCGTRGTGKTTLAKIFSRAINCLDLQDGDPCNQCTVCRGILEGSLLDVVEMDAASNNSVDDIRDIRDEVIYAPAIARYKVYIIDEVHMLSQGAFNALLKTLEEPPEQVVFILATTEPQKLPATVLSRCQRFDFKRITAMGIAKRLGEIAEDCEISITQDALLLLARLSGGAMRDAISLLDQLTTLGHEKVDTAEVNEMAGFASNERIRELAGLLSKGDVSGSWSTLDVLMAEGRDLSQLCVQLMSWFRNVMLLQLSGKDSPLLDLHPDDLEQAGQMAQSLQNHELNAWLRELASADLRLRRTDNPRIMMEVLLLQLCTRSAGEAGQSREISSNESEHGTGSGLPVVHTRNDGIDSVLLNRLAQLERQVEVLEKATREGIVRPSANAAALRDSTSGDRPSGEPSESSRRDTSAGTLPSNSKRNGAVVNEDAGARPFSAWASVIDEIRRTGTTRPGGMKLYAYVLDTECLQIGEDQLRIVVSAEDQLKRRILSQSDSVSMMEEAVKSMTGAHWQFKLVDPKEAESLKRGDSAALSANQQHGHSSQNANGMLSQQETGTRQPSGDEALDRLLDFGRETGISVSVRDE